MEHKTDFYQIDLEIFPEDISMVSERSTKQFWIFFFFLSVASTVSICHLKIGTSTQIASFHESLICVTDSGEDSFMITTIVTLSSLGSTDIYPRYHHNLHRRHIRNNLTR